MQAAFLNPFKPGAGHQPPYLAGRAQETEEFRKLLTQHVILENLVLTGLRGVGKTVLLDSFKPLARENKWVWLGAEISESVSVSEENLAIRIITDISTVTSNISIGAVQQKSAGFIQHEIQNTHYMNYEYLMGLFQKKPGLISDKLKYVIEVAWNIIHRQNSSISGIIIAYDEAQNLSDNAIKEQYPLSLLLDTFQSLQKMDIPIMLALSGLPTLFPKLVEARTFAERMFHVVFLDSLSEKECKEAITKPIANQACPLKLSDSQTKEIYKLSGGYPYFIQFICKEVYDTFLNQIDKKHPPVFPTLEITQKLDSDFFMGRWARVTDRQRELLTIVAFLDNSDNEFSVQEVVDMSSNLLIKPFGNSHVNQMFSTLSKEGLVYKNRHGKYSYAVPLLRSFILRQNDANPVVIFANKQY